MEELTAAWGKFGLSEAEKVIIYDESDGVTEGQQEKFFLVGSVWTIRPYSNHTLLNMMK